jgi:transcriptional regulator with XRE-family HTH domain
MNDTTWSRYVRRISGASSGSEIAARTRVGQSTVSRWLNDSTSPSTAQAAKFAQTYGANVLEAFVAAGFLTEEEAGMPPRPEVDFYALVDEDPALSTHAKIHLKNQYGLLRSASAHSRTHEVRERIVNDPDLDEATRDRLLAHFAEAGVTVAYTSSATVIEGEFPRADVSGVEVRITDLYDEPSAAHPEPRKDVEGDVDPDLQ